MKVFIGSDHRGFKLKEKLKPWLTGLGHEVVDCGALSYDKNDDYPDFSFAVSERVVKDRGMGIVICGSGIGVTVAANKVPGARCSTGVSPSEIKRGREDDDLNVLAISGDYTSESDAKVMIKAFLTTPFVGDERHVRRLRKVEARENG